MSSSNYKLKASKLSGRRLPAADVVVLRPEQEDAESRLAIHPALYYRRYVLENSEAIGYIAYQGWQREGRGCVALTPLWEKDDPEFAVVYVSKANLLKLPLLESLSPQTNRFPNWYVGLAKIAQSQLKSRLNSYDPQAEVVVLGQVEDMSQVFPDEELYKQIHSIEIFTFSDFALPIQSCYKRFEGRASEFIL